MKNKSWMVMFMIFVLLVTSSPMASAFWGKKEEGEKFRGERHKIAEKIADELRLTDAQEAKFEKKREETRKYVESKMEEIKKLGEQLKNELGKDKPSRSVVHDLIKKISNLRNDIELRHMDNMLELREDLTPEQLKRFKKMLKMRPHEFGPPERPRR